MGTFCGLDFGTSNSTIGVSQDNHLKLVPLEDNKPTLRSAIFSDLDLKQLVYGQEGINRYLEGCPGRLMTALKTVLGSSLMDEKTVIFNKLTSYTEVLKCFLEYVKKAAEKSTQHELTQVVLGRPVRFHDHDQRKDNYAQETLENIARQIGFRDIAFQYEPIAAALAYEATIQAEHLALIVDIGGGTSDFTVIRLSPGQHSNDRSQDVLANHGVHIAGTNFDQKFSLKTVMPQLGMGSLMRGSSSTIQVPSAYYHDLTTWHTLSNLYSASTINSVRSILSVAFEKKLITRLVDILTSKGGHHILMAVEKGKQTLSQNLETLLDLEFIEKGLSVVVQRNTFNDAIGTHLKNIVDAVLQTVKLAGVDKTKINAIFYTGGSTKIPIIHELINLHFINAKVVQGDAFGSVGLGLTIEAQRLYK